MKEPVLKGVRVINIGAFLAALASALLVAMWPATVAAQVYPNRPLKFIVPIPPGGAYDYLARVLAERMQASLGQPVIVENKPGAGTRIGTDFVAKQAPDGYTLLISSNTHVILPALFTKMPYDTIRDFEPISLIVDVPFMLAVNAAVPATSSKEYVELARSKPSVITFGSSGVGTPYHLGGELLKSLTGIDIVHVPYKGGAALIQALLAGEISSTFGPMNQLLPHVRSGRIRPIAAVGTNRVSLLSDIPTLAESLPLPGYALDNWFGVLAPAATPRPIVDRINAEINRTIRDPQFIKEKLAPESFAPVGTTPERYLEVMKADMEKYAKIVRHAKIPSE